MSKVFALLALVFFVFYGSAVLEEKSCKASWEPQFKPQWSFWTACTIVIKDGSRIPAKNFRAQE